MFFCYRETTVLKHCYAVRGLTFFWLPVFIHQFVLTII